MKKFVINLVIDTLLTTNKTSKSLDNQPDLLKPFNHCRYFFGSDLLINSSVFLQHKLNGNKQAEKVICKSRNPGVGGDEGGGENGGGCD